ncbi:unnamed protein product [Amaranthus hypochondriacus]
MVQSTILLNSNIPNHINSPTNQPKSSAKSTKDKVFNLINPQIGKNTQKPIISESLGLCKCGRRHLMEAITGTVLQTCLPSFALEPTSSTMEMLKKIHPPRSDWYEEFYASVLNNSMNEYEAEISGYKSQLFEELMRQQAKQVLEIGIGTGPNLKYYATHASMVYGIDPNAKMEKYARKAAASSGLPPENFKFLQAVGEALPLDDASVDAVVGTLVLCSVNDVNRTLQEVKRVLKPGGLYMFVEHVAANDGTALRLLQTVLNPLQQLLADGCHLTRETGSYISQAGFSSVDSSTTYVSSFLFVNPHLYGIAHK